ncbi:MAG: hypothetical protein JRD88_04945 [Deltaproteobacteria bacterium]|nr:hypothetical protein [Deltaproteobacteria bacterium]
MQIIQEEKLLGRFRYLLDNVAEPTDLVLSWDNVSAGQRKGCLAVAATDKEGLLTILSGLLTAYGIGIHSAEILPVVDERQPSQAKILDLLDLNWQDKEFTKKDLENFTDDLKHYNAKLVKDGIEPVRDEISELVAARFAAQTAAQEQMLPVEIEIDNDSVETDTLLHIQSRDTPGFLFAFSNALSLLAINVVRATIHTDGNLVQDIFHVRDMHGRKIIDQDKLFELRFVCALIKQFAYLLPHSSNPGQAIRQFRDFTLQFLPTENRASELSSIHSVETLQMLAEVMGVSRFLWEDFLRMQHENLFPLVQDRSEIEHDFDKQTLQKLLNERLKTETSLDKRVGLLNQVKDREMFRIDLRHITRLSNDTQFAEELSDLADVIVDATADLCHTQLDSRFGHPLVEERPCPWAILAAGKFGGREMGFASDLELLFVYGGAGHTSGPKTVDNSAYFENFVRTFLKTLQTRKEGIFEIDLRLRPFGDKGTLACSLKAFQNYFSPDGQAEPFERMAMVKLRAIAGDEQLCREALNARDRFVYSGEPFDVGNLLHLRQRMVSELTDKHRINVKYSPGMLVDIEFYLQALQIKHGAEDLAVRKTNSMEALNELLEAGVIDTEQAESLSRAYRCFRRTIDALRAVRGNAKDLVLPDQTTPDFKYLARRLDFEDAQSLSNEINWCRNYCDDLLEKL